MNYNHVFIAGERLTPNQIYKRLDAILGNSQSKVVGNNTRLERVNMAQFNIPKAIVLRYHDTAVVGVTPRKVDVNTGGWNTITTKERINAFITPLGKRVYSKNHELFLYDSNIDESKPFKDGMKVS